VESTEKELLELRKRQEDIGVATERLNRLPIFEPTLRAEFQVRTFESKHGRLFVEGRLGQNHKSLLEAILYKRKIFKRYKDEKGNTHIKVLYNEYEVRKYLSEGSIYSHERYKKLIEDMKQVYIKIEKEERIIEGKLITNKTTSNKYSKQTKSNLPSLKGKKINYGVLELGDVITQLILEEFCFTYNPKPIISLNNGISQALVRYLRTYTRHPTAGYHLKPLIEALTGEIENKRWWKTREYLKEDAKRLESFGVVINFKEDRLYVVEKQ